MMSDFVGLPTHGLGYEPVWLTMRKAIEKTDYNNDGENNTGDIHDAINENQMGFADGFIVTALSSSNSGTDDLVALVAEVAPQNPLITFRSNSYGDNIPGDNLYAANFEIKRNNSNHYCPRYYAVINAIGDGTNIGSEENWQIMRDNSNGATGNIQFMQFIPELDFFRITVYRDGSPAYLKPAMDFSISELFDLQVGVSSQIRNNEIKLFPNPVRNKLKVKFPLEYIGKDFTVFSMGGKSILHGIIENEFLYLETENILPGVYLFKIDNAKGTKLIIH